MQKFKLFLNYNLIVVFPPTSLFTDSISLHRSHNESKSHRHWWALSHGCYKIAVVRAGCYPRALGHRFWLWNDRLWVWISVSARQKLDRTRSKPPSCWWALCLHCFHATFRGALKFPAVFSMCLSFNVRQHVPRAEEIMLPGPLSVSSNATGRCKIEDRFI